MNWKFNKRIIASWLMLVSLSACSCSMLRSAIVEEDSAASGSMCTDALRRNQQAAGCIDIATVEAGTYTKVYCVTYRDDAEPADRWLIDDFYIIPIDEDPEMELLADAKPLCLDTFYVVLTSPGYLRE